MRVGFVRNVGLLVTAASVLALGACNDNPLDFDVKNTTRIDTNPSSMVVSAGRDALLESRAVNQGNEPTFDDVSATVDATCGSGAITVVVDPDWLPDIQPPGRFLVSGGATLGQSCVTLTSGSNTAQIDVVVVTDAIEITSPVPDQVFRAGDTGQIVAQLIDVDGGVVGPYVPEDAIFASSDAAVASIDDDVGNFTAAASGTANLSVTWGGQASNGTSGLGVVRNDEVTIEVIANVAVSAAFTAGTNLGVLPVGEIVDFDVFVADALGNRNTLPDEIISVTAQSSDETVATVVARIATDDAAFGQGDVPVVEVTTLAAGPVTISGVVTTSEGDFPFTGVLLVPNPVITAITPSTGSFAETVVITGLDFAPISEVYVGGYLLGNFTIDSPTQITAQMPTYSTLPGPLDVVVSVAGIESPPGTWEQTTSFDEGATEDNSFFNTGGQAEISVPAFIAASLIGEADDGLFGLMADWYFFTISGTEERTIEYINTPIVGAEDMQYDVIDGGFNFFWCGTDDNTGPGTPDFGECDLPAAGEELDPGVLSTGTWWLIPTEWGNADVNYNLVITMAED